MAGENTNIIRRDNKIIIKNVAALGDAGVIEIYSDDETTKVGEITADGVGDFTTLKIGGVAVTSTAAELNILDGVTKTAVQINALPIVEQTAVADVASADGVAAAGANPTKAEFDAVVTLANEIKAQLNSALAKLRLANVIADA